MSTLGKIVYLSEAQASELFANGSITVDGSTITYSADDLYLTPENIEYVQKSGDTMSGTLATPRLNIVSNSIPVLWYMSDDTTDAGQVGLRLSDKRYFIGYRNNANKNIYFSLPPLSSDNTSESTWYDILTTKGDYAMTGTLTVPAINIYASSYPGIGFQESANSTNEGRIYFDRPTNRFVLAQFADNSEFSEAYLLPVPEVQSATKWYNIITTKDHPTYTVQTLDWSSSDYINANYDVWIEKALDTVRFQGLFVFTNLTANTTVEIGTIPSGYRPVNRIERTIGISMNASWNSPGAIGSQFVLVSVYSNGVVKINPGSTPNTNSFWIDMTWCI